MKRFFRFRLRTLFVLIAVVALGIVFVPRWLHRHRVNRALSTALKSGPDLLSAHFPLTWTRETGLPYMLSDLDRVLNNLNAVLIDRDEPFRRRENAAATIELLLSMSGDAAQRSKWLQQLIPLATDDAAGELPKDKLLETISGLIEVVGVSPEQRAQLRQAAQREPLTPVWAKVLIAIGGQEELVLVLEQGGTHDENLLWAIHNSNLMGMRWPGLLPYAKKWLEDPIVAESRVMDYWILNGTEPGRRILLEYAIDSGNPLPLRTRALDSLKVSQAGINLVLDAAKDPQMRGKLDKLAGGNITAAVTTANTSVRKDYTDDFWNIAIAGLTPSYWLQNHTGTAQSPKVEAQLDKAREQFAATNLKVLQRLTGRTDLIKNSAWRDWRATTQPKPPTDTEILEAIIKDPSLLSSGIVLHRVLPSHLGEIPPETMPLYKQMLHSSDLQHRYWAAFALMTFSDDVDAVPVLIEMLRSSTAADLPTPRSRSGVISLLRDRFAVNFFYDADAWQKWWDQHRTENDAPATVK